MDIALHHERFQGQHVAVRAGGLCRDPRLVLNGVPLSPNDGYGRFTVLDNAGNPVSIELSPTWLDPIPTVRIEQETLQLARPLTLMEYLWMCLPLVLVLTGGALGVLIGLTAIYASARIFRGQRSTFGKYGLSALISMAAVLTFLVLGGIADFLVAGDVGR